MTDDIEKKRARWRRAKRAHNLRKNFNMSVPEYDAMLANQGGVCLVCEKVNASGQRLSVDHCHTTGRIRGLLCAKCNRAIGLLDDNPRSAQRLVGYLA